MPNTKSAKKDLLISKRNHERNVAVKSRLKTLRGKALSAIATDPATAEVAVKLALKEFDTAATKGIIHPNTAARRKSHLVTTFNEARQA